MGKYRTRELTQRVRYALLAGVAGAFLIPQVAAAAPTGEHDMTDGVTVGRTTTAAGTNTNITAPPSPLPPSSPPSSTPPPSNNVIKWADYSVKQGETVTYDANNYLNIVTGGNTSAINGSITGGGDIYLVNPNGVIFGKTASVNVGNLYVSTQDTSTVNASGFETSGTPPLSTTVTDVGKADVVNMGSITANKVEVYGRSIRILDAANVHATTSPVVLHIDEETNGGYAHIGYQSGSVPSTSDYEIHKKVTPTTPPSSPPTTVVAAATAADNYYQLVSTPTEFQDINNDLTKNYMLANDIDFYDSVTGTKTSLTPIGGDTHAAFSGKFDGNFFRIQNFTVSGTSRAGAFGETNGARIDNVGITGATITGGTTTADYAGGVVGYATSSTLKNVYSDSGTRISGAAGRHGGIAGYTSDTTIESAYSKATIGAGGGIIGNATANTKVTDTYSEVISTGYTGTTPLGAWFIYNINPITGPGAVTVDRAYYVGDRFSYSNVSANIQHVYKIDKNTINSTYKATIVRPTGSTPAPQDEKEGLTVGTYTSEWGNAINNTGAPGAKWRIYEGRTLPLLTAFMDGTATATYDIRYFNANRTLNSDKTNTAKSNNGADITTGLTYNSQYVKIVGKDALSGDTVVGGKSNVVAYAGAMQYNADGTPNLDHIYDYVGTTGTNDFDKTNGIRNAGTKAILWSDQDGPNLRGVNVTIGKRKVDMTVADLGAERQYNGKLDVKDAFIEKLLGGGISTPGFTSEDTDPNHPTVSLNTTGFTATMVDKHVGTGKVANFGGSIGLSGEDKDNYDFDGNLAGKTGTVNIYKAPLLLSFRKKKAAERVYDGTSVVRDDAMKQSVSPGNISIDTTIAADNRGEVMTDETGTKDILALANITDPKYTDTEGNEQIHQGAHKLQYTNVKLRTDGIYSSGQDYELYYTPDNGTEEQVTNDTVYLDGSIIRRQIKTGDFKVYHKTDNSAADATKVYDGTATYDLNDPRYSDIYLSSNVGATDDDTGVVARDQGHITFLLQNGTTATFMTDEQPPSETKNVKTAKKIAYKVHADADTDTDRYGGHLLDDYWVVNDKNTALTESTNFNATGKGTITPKALTATVVKNHITKVYDTKQNQTDGNRNDIIGGALVTLSGFATVNGVLESRTNTSTADYASPNVVWDATNQTEKAQNVTYHVSFDRGTGDESENYILDANATGDARYGIELTQDSAGKNYTGTITPRPITITMGTVDKIYDGTAVNTKSNITGLAGKTAGDTIAATVLADDGITAATLKAQHAAMLSAGTAHSSFGRVTGNSFAEDVNASNGTEHDVRYQNVGDVLQEALAAAKKHNYTIDDTIYGKGTINRRLIEKSGFQVRKTGGTPANATKVYDGTNTFTLAGDEYLVAKPSTNPSATPGTGIVAKDVPNIVFKMTGNEGHFLKSGSGTAVSDRTTHVSEAARVAYDVYADTLDGTTSPLSNYEFGTTISKRDLEAVTAANPDAVTAEGRITSAKIVAETVKNLNKTYDGVTGYTKGDRNTTAASVTGENVIKFKHLNQNGSLTDGLINDASGMPVNSSTAAYVDKNVLYNTQKEPVAKAMNYTAKLTGTYADDYVIVDANDPNTKLSTMTEPGGTKNVSTVFNNVADAGTISPRKLTIEMDKDTAEKTYDGTAENKKAKVNAITSEDIASNVLRQILDDDGISENALTNRYVAKLTATPPTATSTYGRFSGTTFNEDANASNGNLHDVRYQNMKDTFDEAFASGAGKEKIAGNYTFDNTVYGKGTITRKAITPDTFKVSGGKATKAYDGTSAYTVPAGSTLTANTGELVGTDASKIQFAISGNSAKFMKTDGVTETANVADARKVAYNITVSGDRDTIRNYTLNGQNLESGNLTASGDGEITRRALSLGLVQDEEIDKFYDGSYRLVDKGKNWNKLKDEDEKGNVVYTGTNKLVNDGTSLTITSEYRNDANTDHDKNVRGTSASPQVKDILYNISITGGDPNNYSFDGGTSSAAGGLKLSAKGTIKPKDISNAFQPMTKVYDGGTTVDRSKVNLESGTFIGSDSAWVKNTYQAEFESPNVNGNSEGKNWVNYTHLELDGTNANNYTIASATTGKGNITPYILNSDSVKFTTREASKVYDGTTDVKWTNGSSEPNDVKNYITGATVELTPAGGGATTTKSVLEALNLTEKPQYDKKDVDGGSATDRVTYKLSYTGTNGNFSLGTGVTSFTTKGDGIITPKDVNVTVKSLLTKTYDATENVTAGTVKNAAGETVSDLNKNITLDGIVAGDGTTYTTTAAYDNKNAGTNKTVTYDVKLDAASAGNYTLKFNNAKVSTSNPVQNGKNEITKRKVDVTFGDVSKLYDTTTKNNKPIVGTVSAEDAAVLNTDHAGLVADDTPNNIKNKLQNLAGLDSDYGTVKTDGSFDADPNVGTKSVQYAGLRNRMNTTLGGDAGNYEFDVNGYGKGSIARRTIDASKFKFKTNAFAEKEYDGTRDVKWQGDKDKIKNYFASSKVEIDGVERDINLKDIDVSTEYSKYRTKDVGAYQTTADGKKYNAKVDYRISFSSQNFDITGLTTGGYIPYEDNGIITPKDVNVTVKSLLRKNYDATENVTAGMVKNAAGETVSDLNKNITLDGIVAGDGTTYTTTAAYDNKNAGTNKTVTYDVKLDAASAGNYTLKFNNAKVSTSNPVQNGKNEITKRKVDVTFGDVSKLYDTTTKNNKPIVGTVSAEDAAVLNTDHAGLVADDTPNNIKNKLQNLAGLDSDYGTVKTDGSFDADPNVGTKSVQYAGLRNRMNTTLGGDAGNYEFDVNGYGKGSIARRTIDASKFKFKTNAFAEKEYDGTRDVKWQGDKDKIKNYFASSKVEIDGVERDINLKDIDVSTEYSKYRTKDVGAYQTTADGKKYNAKVDYRISFSSDNFDITGLTAGGYIPYEDKGLITPKDITPYFTKDHIIKEYDGSSRLSDPNKEAIEKTKRLSILVQGDDVTLDVVGRYMDSTRTQEEKNASADTKEDAQARTNTTAGLSVAYDLKLGGAQKNNYTIGAQGDTGTVYGAGDIYKKTLTVTVKNIDKVYDGTSTVVRDAGGGILVPHPEAGKLEFDPDDFVRGEEFSFDQTAADKIDGDYSDPNVNPNGDGTKSITYRKLSQAFADNATRGTAARYAKNYRVEDTAQGRGKITPRKVSAADFALSFSNAVKTYDNRDTVKPNKGMRSLNDLLNDNATVKIGTGAVPVAKKELDVLSGTYGGTDAGTYDNVTYTLRYTGHNLNVTDALTQDKQKGEIIKRAVTVDVLGSLWKYYDGTEKLYQTGDRSIKTYRGSMEVKEGDDIVYMSRANGADDETGLLSDDSSTNVSTAHFVGKDAGDDKNVAYTFAIGGANAKNYQLVNIYNEPQTAADTKGGNTIRKRPLDIVFKDVRKEYDTTDVNRSATPYVNDADATVLQRDGAGVRPILDAADQQKYKDRKELRLIDRRSGKALSVASAYEPSMDAPHIPAANAGDKSVRYSGVGSALRSILGTDADKNYDLSPLDENLYGNGRIDKARISASDFRLKFTPANKEYDGGYTISDARSYLHPDSKMRLPHTPVPPDQEWTKYRLTDTDVERMTGTYRAVGGKRPQDVGRKPVDYEVKLKDDNFIFGEWKGTDFTEGKWDGVIRASEWGDITPREIFEDSRSPLTKVYDGTRNIANVGDDLLTFRHKSGKRPFIKNDDVRNSSTATYDNANVAWKNNVWKQGEGTVGDVNVTYRLKLTGRDAENYKIVSAPGRVVKDSVDQDGTRTQTTDGTGKITPRDIHLKADPQTRWINEGLPKSYTGKPMGSNLGRKDVPELAPGEVLPGQIEYSSPNARLRWGDYAINGIYRAPKAGTRYQLPDGTWTTQSFAGGDGDAVSRNYRFVQDPANKSAFHMGPYIPDYEYYKALTQTSKMTPDEYAYENASLDRRSNFGRDAEAEIDYMPPSINMVKDGVDITQTGIHVTDETVFSLVNEVFGGK